ncbi:aminotransferase class I/II-fold pyridoxal phosphate-dependent enzyme [Lautropia mirabilis]|uniref:aminotransferase class I/II-fold pyridoxal phosphate-dependent enzyme n=1 Tax=Lautropia mirabilis TaxID=47671 RepID=UPI0028EF1956|nr:aminotransferase class I/II-fold pyridoxal phosphate-dependent enzyme [Lautropia mirabilis]
MPLHDFSTNANATGPCPAVLQRLQQLVPDTYPDPAYASLRALLARWHDVTPARVVMGASASELIMRLTAAALPDLASVWVPRHAYGDYRRAADAWGLMAEAWEAEDRRHVSQAFAAGPPSRLSERGGRLVWITWPASPQGDTPPALAGLAKALTPKDMVVLDMAYAPLRLDAHVRSGAPDGGKALPEALAARACRLFSPNKALGLTGVRGAYLVLSDALALTDLPARLLRLAPSWPLGMHGQAMLEAWTTPGVQQWLAQSRKTLQSWKATLESGLLQRGWQLMPSVASFCCARPPVPLAELPAWLAGLRTQGIKLRDATSFGLPGWVRLGVRAPASQQALWQAVDSTTNLRTS